MKVKSLSHVRLLATPWTAAHQTPPSTDFPGKSTGVGCHCLLRLSSFSHVQFFAALWTVAHQSPLSMGFSRQEYRSGLPFLSPWALPDPGIEPGSPALQVDSLPSETPYVCFLCIFICLLVRSGNGEHSPLVHIFPFLRYNLHIVKKYGLPSAAATVRRYTTSKAREASARQ